MSQASQIQNIPAQEVEEMRNKIMAIPVVAVSIVGILLVAFLVSLIVPNISLQGIEEAISAAPGSSLSSSAGLTGSDSLILLKEGYAEWIENDPVLFLREGYAGWKEREAIDPVFMLKEGYAEWVESDPVYFLREGYAG